MLKPKDWFEGKNFTANWAGKNFPTWSEVLPGFVPAEPQILEVGAYEGRSVIFWLEFFSGSSVTCIDAYQGFTNQPVPQDRSLAEARFDENVAPYVGRVRKLKMRSASGLDLLQSEACQFDLIYIDGDHSRAGVMTDSLLSWPLLKPNGVMIWDDYKMKKKGPKYEPQQAIDLFLEWHADELEVVHQDYQVIVRKSGARTPTMP